MSDNSSEYNIDYIVINCDEYLNTDKELFLTNMNILTNTTIKVFPIVFKDSKFIGGFKEGINEIHRICFDMEDNF